MKHASGAEAEPRRIRRSGFTLVELIVVIVILAILAGVAIPVYSSYVNKANEAADIQLISAVNTAFAASCLENGTDAKKVTHAELMYAAEDGRTRIIGVRNVEGPGLDGAAVSESFVKFFGNNANTTLKYYKENQLHFNTSPDPLAGTFTAGELEETGAGGVLDAGHEWTGDLAGTVAAYNASNWKTMGVDGLTQTVDHVAGALKIFGNMQGVLNEAEGFDAILAQLSIDPSLLSKASLTDGEKATLSNAAVFYVADRLKNADATALKNAMLNDQKASMGLPGAADGNLDTYLATLGIDASENHREYQLVTAALKYSMAVSFANSSYGDIELNELTHETLKDRVTNASLGGYQDVMNVYDLVENQKGSYLSYLNNSSKGGRADLDALTKILGVLNGNSDAFLDISGSNLFSSQEVQAAINEILGNTP